VAATLDGKVTPSASEHTKSGSNVILVGRLETACVLDFVLLGVPEREVILSVVMQSRRSKFTL
jgi:hypothetical protein